MQIHQTAFYTTPLYHVCKKIYLNTYVCWFDTGNCTVYTYIYIYIYTYNYGHIYAHIYLEYDVRFRAFYAEYVEWSMEYGWAYYAVGYADVCHVKKKYNCHQM